MNKKSIHINSLIILIFGLLLIGCSDKDEMPELEWVWGPRLDFGRQPIWSPDGSKLLFGDDRVGRASLWVWDTNNSPDTLIRIPHNWDYGWSPNGDYVVFSSPSLESDTTGGIWIIEVNTKSLRHFYPNGSEVCWFGDGSAIVARLDSVAQPGIYLLPLDGSSPSLIIANCHRPKCPVIGPLLAYVSNDWNGALMIQKFNDGFPQTPIAVSDTGVVEWCWSADGSKLFYVLSRLKARRLENVLISIDCDGRTLDTLSTGVGSPAPDRTGTRIAIAKWVNARWEGLWLINSDKTETRIAEYGLQPSFNTHSDRIAISCPSGGIAILERVH